MSTAGGVSGVEQKQQPYHAEQVKGETVSKTQEVGLGFSEDNVITSEKKSDVNFSVDHQAVRLPVPTVHVGDSTPEMQKELARATTGLDNFDRLMDRDGDGVSVLDEYINHLTAGLESGEITDPNEFMQQEGMGNLSFEEVFELEEKAFGVTSFYDAIESAPPELMEKIDNNMAELGREIELGNMENVAALLARIQTQLQDTRIRFDQETLQATRTAQQKKSNERVGKLMDAIDKMEEKKITHIITQVFGAIATALSIVVGTVLIATGVLSKVGIVLMLASMTLMVALTVSQNSGNWMNKVFGEGEINEMVAGIAWSVLAIGLSLGASACTVKKSSVDLVQKGIDLSTKITAHAKTAGHIAQGLNAGAMLVDGSAQMAGSALGYEAGLYQADATRDLAFIRRMQMQMDDLIDALQRSIREINDGHRIVSDIMEDAIKGKTEVSKNI